MLEFAGRVWGRRLRPVLLAGMFAAGTGAGAADIEEYLLQPGDTVRLSVLGVPDLSIDATIGADGQLRLPQIGRVRAEDLTIDDLQDAVATSAAGQIFRVRAPDNSANLLSITSDDIFVSLVSYRPVTLAGDVQNPGVVDFRPGLTLRAALATVGGPSRFAVGRDPLQNLTAIPRLRADHSAAILERARLVAEQWRLEAELELASIDAPPQPERMGVDPQTAEALRQDQLRILQLSGEELATQRSFAETSREQIAARRKILEQQEENQVAASRDDEEELERVRRLQANGIVPIQRLLDIRRAQLLSATRLLDTQNNLERVNQELNRVAFDDSQLESRRRRQLLVDLDRNRTALRLAELRIEALQEEMEMNGVTAFAAAGAAPDRMTCTVFRNRGARIESAPITLDEVLVPGDVVQIALIRDTQFAWGGSATPAQQNPQDQPADCGAVVN